MDLGSPSTEVNGGMPQILQAHSLFMNSKPKSGNEGWGGAGSCKWSIIWVTQGFLEGELHVLGGLALYPVV